MKNKRELVLAVSLLLAACGGGSKNVESNADTVEQPMESAEQSPDSAPATMAESAGHQDSDKHAKMMAMCPMHVEGTTMALVDAEQGMAMEFTNAANVAEVRERTKKLAEHHTKMMSHHKDDALPAHTATVEDTDSGARLVLKPIDPTQVDALRAELKKRQAAQGDKQCPMMMLHGKKKHGDHSGRHDKHGKHDKHGHGHGHGHE